MDKRLTECLDRWSHIFPEDVSRWMLKEQTRLINRINSFVNSFQYKKDPSRDYWKNISEFVEDRGGDCEDYEIAKGSMLHHIFPHMKIELVLCLNLYTRRGHAVLRIQGPEGTVYLDNDIQILYGQKYFDTRYKELSTSEWPISEGEAK